MKKFTETFWGKILVYITGIISVSLIVLLTTIVITAWEQPTINDRLEKENINIRKEIRTGDSSVKKYIDERQENIMSGMKNIFESINHQTDRIDKLFDRKNK
jgi:hypothetical protein